MTIVTVEMPPPPPAPKSQTLCTIAFDRDNARPTRVDNEAIACLDDVGLNLQHQSDATLVLVGEASSGESRKVAAQRAANTKAYLVLKKGIDSGRIMVRIGREPGKIVRSYLVPAGADFDIEVPGTAPVNEKLIKSVPR